MIPLLDASADVMTPRGRILSQQTTRKGKAKGPTPGVKPKLTSARQERGCEELSRTARKGRAIEAQGRKELHLTTPLG